MPQSTIDALRAKWVELQGGDPLLEDVQDLLTACIDAGGDTIDAGVRLELQALAREIAKEVFDLTDNFPNAVIRPARAALVQPDDWLPARTPVYPPDLPRRWLKRVVVILGVLVLVCTSFAGWAVWEWRGERAELKRSAATQLLEMQGQHQTEIASVERDAESARKESRDFQERYQTERTKVAKAEAALAEEKERALRMALAESIASSFASGIDRWYLAQTTSDRDSARAAARGLQQALSQTLDKLPDTKAISAMAEVNCIKIIRGCRLTEEGFEGVFRMSAAGKNVWVSPRNANLAALALLSARQVPDADRTKDRDEVRRWLLWYADRQDRNSGAITDFVGEIRQVDGKPAVTLAPRPGQPDAEASGTYLLVVERYYRLSPKEAVPAAIKAAVRGAYQEILGRAGLPGPGRAEVKFLKTGIIDCGGLVAAREFYRRIGDDDSIREIDTGANKIADRLGDFWQPQKLFAQDFINGAFAARMESLADVEANLAGLAWVRWDERNPWDAAKGGFKPGDVKEPFSQVPLAPVELWLAAAYHIDPEQAKLWHSQTVHAAVGFSTDFTYLNRVAVTLLTLSSEGPSWLPNIKKAKGEKWP